MRSTGRRFSASAGLVRILLQHDPPIGVRDAHYDSTPLGWCVHGATQGYAKERATLPPLRDF